MKLNLLPTTVRKGAKARTAWIICIVMILAGIGATAFMMITSSKALYDAKVEVAEARPKNELAVATAAEADTIIAQAQTVVLNTSLSKAMLAHNGKYPALYDSVIRYIPSFYRVTSMTAAPIGENSSQITLVGTLDSFQQYADLMLALLRYPGAQSVSRQGFVVNDKVVPPLSLADPVGRPRRLDEAPIPDDPLERLAYFEAQGAGTGDTYTGASNFGTGTTDTRFQMPTSSLVTVQIVVNRDLRVPDVRGTLAGAGSAPAATSTVASAPSLPGTPTPPSGGRGSDED